MQLVRVFVGLSMISGLLLAVGLNPQDASAANVTVQDGSDYPCTRDGLADAIDAAATTNPDNPGLVTFNCPSPTITFNDEIEIGDWSETVAVTIDGSNNGTPIIFDVGDATKFFSVFDDDHLTVQHLTMQNGGDGSAGGAISVGGFAHLAVTDVTFNDNHATLYGGAIYNDGTSTITQSSFIGNSAYYGGAIRNSGQLTITKSSFTENDATIGGAIDNTVTLTVTQSSFMKNTAESGGAIHNYNQLTISQSSFVKNNASDHGGAIDHAGDLLTITSSTFSGNTATNNASAINAYAKTSTTIFWSTIVQPDETTPALFFEDDLTLTGVIFGGNGDHCEYSGDYSLSFNDILTNDDSCAPDSSESWENQTLLLGPLSTATINGVEHTYYPLLEGSPALDSGPATCDTDILPDSDPDQLGYPRPDIGNCSIGAIESNNLPPIIDITEPSITINESQSINISFSTNDPNNDTLTSTIECDINDTAGPISGLVCT